MRARSSLATPSFPGPPGVEVLLLGPLDSEILDAIEAALRSDGWPTARIEQLCELERVNARHKAVVVVRTQQAEPALRILEALEPKRHSAMVIVVVDRADPGEYYCLAQAGAIAYFEVCEDPDLIVQGIEWAAHVLAP